MRFTERLHAMHRFWRYRLRQDRLELALVRKQVGPGQTVLDVGANIAFKSEYFVNFALMGMALQKIRDIKKPNVGLLNIGSEAKKLFWSQGFRRATRMLGIKYIPYSRSSI